MFGGVLGEGAYARVVIAEKKADGNRFAVKILLKSFVVKEGKMEFVMMERNILTKAQHRRIIKLHHAFMDSDNLYFVLELCPGGHLLKIINMEREKKEKLEKEDEACDVGMVQFYMAEIIIALEYLHKMGIVHRDLKPENILLDATGHVKVADFGTALDIVTGGGSGNQFVGTAEYVAPEVLDDEPVGIACDLWALGCTLFQLFTGRPPFSATTDYLTFLEIKEYTDDPESFDFPACMTPAAIDLTKQFLLKDPSLRIGAGCKVVPQPKKKAIKKPDGGKTVDEDEKKPGGEAGQDEKMEEPAADEVAADAPEVNGYDAVRAHAFWDGIDFALVEEGAVPYSPPADCSDQIMLDASEMDDEDMLQLTPVRRGSTVQEMYMSRGGASHSLKEVEAFLDPCEKLIKHGEVMKRQGMWFGKVRVLLLATGGNKGPRLMYVDPETPAQNGSILLLGTTGTDAVDASITNRRTFKVVGTIGDDSFQVLSLDQAAEEWVIAINQALETGKRP
jgi:hypothetical protein